MSAQLQHVSSAAPCQFRWNLYSQLHHKGWAVVCLVCNLQKDKFEASIEDHWRWAGGCYWIPLSRQHLQCWWYCGGAGQQHDCKGWFCESLRVGLNTSKQWSWFWHSAHAAATSSPQIICCECQVRKVPLRGCYRALGTPLPPDSVGFVKFILICYDLTCSAWLKTKSPYCVTAAQAYVLWMYVLRWCTTRHHECSAFMLKQGCANCQHAFGHPCQLPILWISVCSPSSHISKMQHLQQQLLSPDCQGHQL